MTHRREPHRHRKPGIWQTPGQMLARILAYLIATAAIVWVVGVTIWAIAWLVR